MSILFCVLQVPGIVMRSQSIFEMDVDLNLKVSNYEETVRQLDVYYGIGECQGGLHNHLEVIA